MDKRLYRSRENKMLAGACGGVAEYFQVDPTIVRIIFAAVTLAFIPGGIIAYVIAAIVMPERKFDSNYYNGGSARLYDWPGGREEEDARQDHELDERHFPLYGAQDRGYHAQEFWSGLFERGWGWQRR